MPTRWPAPDKGHRPALTGGSPYFCYLMLLVLFFPPNGTRWHPAFSRTSLSFGKAALQPVPRNPLDHLIADRGRGRRDRGKRLRAGLEASVRAGDPGVAVIQARPSDA